MQNNIPVGYRGPKLFVHHGQFYIIRPDGEKVYGMTIRQCLEKFRL